MSHYIHNTVIRCKIEPKEINISSLFDLEEKYPNLFFEVGKKKGYFEIAPTEKKFIDYIVKHDGCSDPGTYGFCRNLTKKELELYLPLFKNIIPFVTADMLKHVDYCWYNSIDAPDYFETEEEIENKKEKIETELFKKLKREDLQIIYIDYTLSKESDDRCESLVPYAEQYKKEMDINELSINDVIDTVSKIFFNEIAKRYFQN